METYKIESDGKLFVFNVLKNHTEPCHVCGFPACGREDILWYEYENQRMVIIFDGGSFDLAGEEFFNENIKTIGYDSIPEFMKDWNESKGWESCWSHNGYELDIDDFLKSMELLKINQSEQWITKEEITDFEKLALDAHQKGTILKIVRG